MSKKLSSKIRSLKIWFVFLILMNCGGEGSTFNLFSTEDDKELGGQLATQIENSPEEYPLLSEEDYPDAYDHIRRVRDEILDTGVVENDDVFDWEVKIVHNDDVLNAFAAPGGFIYFYTGIIKYLDTEDELAGVMAHEIAHAAKRHGTDTLTREYGISILLDIAFGTDQNLLTEISHGLVSLSFSRTQETESDTASVSYLAETEYDCTGAAGFFEKLQEEGNASPPEFLSTHPDSGDRVQNIEDVAAEMGCSTELSGNNYQDFKDSLP